MNAKRKILFSFAGLILSIAIFSTVVFAWFSINITTSDMVIETGNIESDAVLYHGKWDGSKYTWIEVETSDDATKIFKEMIPGQIITFRFDLTNSEKSSVDVNYLVRIGKLQYCSDTSTTSTYTDVVEMTETDQHLFNAINVFVSEKYTTIPDDSTVRALSIANPDTFVPIVSENIKKLSEYIPSNKKVFIEKETDNILKPGETVSYIIKFYFNPTFGIDESTNPVTKNYSNHFAHKGFRIEHFVAEFSQKEQITE